MKIKFYSSLLLIALSNSYAFAKEPLPAMPDGVQQTNNPAFMAPSQGQMQNGTEIVAASDGKGTAVIKNKVPPRSFPDFDKFYDQNAKALSDRFSNIGRVAIDRQKRFMRRNKLHASISPSGEIEYVYGEATPDIVCAAMQITDIALEAGEVLQSVIIGDSARWEILNPTSGSTSHIIIRPRDAGYFTTMDIITNRRIYYVKLYSVSSDTSYGYMERVHWIYPDVATAQLHEQVQAKKAEAQAEKEARSKNSFDNDGQEDYIGDLDFNYSIKGNADFRPTRVYNDGKKTIIELPDSTKNKEIPSLLLVSNRTKNGYQIVNNRFHNGKFIVDKIFDKAILTIGVGKAQQIVIITKGKNKNEK